MTDDIKTNEMEIVEEVNETEVPETEELTELNSADELLEEVQEESKAKKKEKTKGAFYIDPKSGKKKMKKGLIALISIVTIIAVITCSIFITMAAIRGAMKGSEIADAPENFGVSFASNNDLYTDYSDHFAQFEDQIEAGMKDDATDAEKVLAAYIIYRVASLSLHNAPEVAKYSTGGGEAGGTLSMSKMFTDPLSVGGGMDMTSTYYTIADGEGNKYIAQEEYTQFPEGAITASEDYLVSIGEMFVPAMLAFARRSIVTPDGTVTWNGGSTSAVITKDGVTGKFKDSKNNYAIKTAEEVAEVASKYERPYDETWGDDYGLTAPDLSIHVINTDTIIADSVVITEKYGEDVNGRAVKYYEVAFEVNPEAIIGKGTDEEGNEFDIHATYYAEQLYLANAGLDFLNALGEYGLRYTELKVNMTVFENGYIRSWSTDETWKMQANILHEGVVDACGETTCVLSSANFSSEYYCYDHDTIMQGFVNRWFGASKYVNKPIEDLPFADKLAGYEAQEYGSYR